MLYRQQGRFVYGVAAQTNLQGPFWKCVLEVHFGSGERIGETVLEVRFGSAPRQNVVFAEREKTGASE